MYVFMQHSLYCAPRELLCVILIILFTFASLLSTFASLHFSQSCREFQFMKEQRTMAATQAQIRTQSQPPAQTSDPFLQARDNFLASLPASERARFSNCKSAQALITDVGKFLEFPNHSSQFNKLVLSKVKQLSDSLKPYFEVINILVSSHPDYAAILWGSLRLVCQVN
jgi:hypothetical protein